MAASTITKPFDWRKSARTATEMAIAITRHIDKTDDVNEIRERIIGYVREALRDTDGSDMFCEKEVDLGNGPEMTWLCNGPGMFRLVLDNSQLNWRDPSGAEMFMVIVQRRVDEVISDPDELARICGQSRE